MRIIRRQTGLDAPDRGASVALGNFDGVHRGHLSVIASARAEAERLGGIPLGVVTFEPHPRAFFAPGAPPFRLMGPEARAHRLERTGVDVLFELPFGPELAAMEAEDFAEGVLSAGLGVRHVAVGVDFRFGRGRRGDAELLTRLGARLGFGVTALPLVSEGGRDISSSAIRAVLSEGRPEEAARMLGHWHRIEGPVIRGDQRGRILGFPTAKMALDGLHLPRFGVYAVLVDVLDGPYRGRYPGAASLGVRPTFGVNGPNIETFLLDFSGDLYGATLSVALVAFLRPELRFDDIDALVVQMNADCAEARAALSAVTAV